MVDTHSDRTGVDNKALLDSLAELTPRKIVDELDKYIIGQDKAKRSVAIALRNRWRRQLLPAELRDEVAPKNIIMIGPTGVGKTEIARRLAGLVNAPFLKVEASKYTEVGYHGRDVDSMVRDLVELSVSSVRAASLKEVESRAAEFAEERLLDLLLPKAQSSRTEAGEGSSDTVGTTSTREKLRAKLRAGQLAGRSIELTVEERAVSMMHVFASSGFEELGIDMQNVISNMFPPRTTVKKVSVEEALRILTMQEAEKLIDKEKVIREGVQRAENLGIIFVDEIDKIASSHPTHGPDVSREGVQRDLLPIVEGTTVVSRYGPVRTHHILFIAAGAFHVSKPSDLIPELQGRFPIRVELDSLGKDEFKRILVEPRNAIVKQYKALLETEGIKLTIKPDAIEEIAETAARVNSTMQNIGARRLYTIMEQLLEEVSFSAPELKEKKVTIDGEYVRSRMKNIVENEDLSRYIL